MKQILITSDILLKYMGLENYNNFIKDLQNHYKIDKTKPIWIIAEFSREDDNGR